MNNNQKISKETREQILARVKEGKDNISVIAEQHGITARTIYAWLSRGLDGASSTWLETSKLKRENDNLKMIIGQLMLEQDRGKKGRHGKKI